MDEQKAFNAMYNITIAYWIGVLTKEQISQCEECHHWDWRHAIREANDPTISKKKWVKFINSLSDDGMRSLVKMYVNDTRWKFE